MDENIFEFTSKTSNNENEAIKKEKDKITELGWDHHQYKFLDSRIEKEK